MLCRSGRTDTNSPSVRSRQGLLELPPGRAFLRVIHVTNYFRDTHSHVGGAEQACFRTALLAANHGWSVHIVATKPDRSSSCQFPFSSLPILEDLTPAIARPYLEAVKWYSFQYDPLAARAFGRVLREDDAPLVHFHNVQFVTLSLIAAAKAAGRRTFVSIYDYWLFCPTVMRVRPDKSFCQQAHGPWCVECLPPKMKAFQRLLLSARRRVINRYLGMVDGFHVLSEHSGSVLEGYGIPKDIIHVVPLTLPMEFQAIPENSAQTEPFTILFAGWLNERKGLHRLLEAMPFVLKEFPQAKLTAVGGKVRFGEEYEKLLDSIMDSNGFRDRVSFLGHLQPSAMKEEIQKASVVVIPEQYENMSPLLMIEAMTMAKPVVISRAGGIPEFIVDGETGFLADPLDPTNFADKILRVFHDPEEARAIGEKARLRILAKCNDETIWTKTREMYDS
jgi:glycosyltransferase involved in cell wall biosynthesis